MGNQASTHNPELIDTSIDDWLGRGNNNSNNKTSRRYYKDDSDDWAPSTRDPRSPKTPTAMRSPKTKSIYDEDAWDPVAPTQPSNVFRPNLEPLVQATAAVFHMNSMDQGTKNAEQGNWSLPANCTSQDDISVSDRSAAVFEHLAEQARNGNHKPFVKLLETASVVSQILMGSQSEASEAEHHQPPVGLQSASSDSTDDDSSDDDTDDDSSDDEESLNSETPAQVNVFNRLNRNNVTNVDTSHKVAMSPRSPKGDIFDRLGNSDIIDVEKMDAGTVFELLDNVKSDVDGNDVKEFSSAIFGMLEDAKSFSQQPPDERKHNIFRMLEENNIMSPREQAVEMRDDVTQEREGDCREPAIDAREDYPEVAESQVDETREIADVDTTDDGKRSVKIQNMEGDPIDLAFVQEFDEVFNEFMGQHPKFILKSPELVHNMRIAKLQKLLAFMNAKEKSVVTDFSALDEKKKNMEDEYQLKLREAARSKAARQIYFQSELDKISHVSNTLEAKFKWAVVKSAETRTKKHRMLLQDFAAEKPDETQGQLLARLPKDVPGQRVLAVMRDDGILSTMTAAQKGIEIRKLQMNIAFLSSEVKIWQSKLKGIEEEKNPVAWVETILQQLSPKQMTRLQKRHQKKSGIQVE